MAGSLPLALAMGLALLVPHSLPAPQPLPPAPSLILLELSQPLPPNAAEEIRARGVEPVGFLPPSSFIVLTRGGIPGVAGRLALASARPLLPEEKLSPLLREPPEDDPQTPSRSILSWIDDSSAPARLVNVLFAGGRETLEPRVGLSGVSPLQWSERSFTAQASPAQVRSLAGIGQVLWIEPASRPVPLNDHAARVLGARQTEDGPLEQNGLSLWSYNAGSFEGVTGAGVNVSIADSGIDGTHPAFDGRRVAYKDYAGNPAWTDEFSAAGHGTMCAGIVSSSGAWRSSDPGGQPGKYAGIAPGAGLIGQAIYGSVLSVAQSCRDALSLGASVQSNSWGYITSFGDYTSDCAEYDRCVRDSDPGTPGEQPLIIVFSAGNSGPTSITVSPPATAKNVISVGATGNDRTGSYGFVSSSSLVSFSSRGPCSDGRIKPDLVAPGVDTYTTSALQNIYKNYLGIVPDDPDASSYFVGGGTSASCPYVAGACALVISYWRSERSEDPSPALVKALLINGATPLPGYTYPGSEQGWGRINVTRSLLPSPDRSILAYDQSVELRQGEISSRLFRVSGQGELRATLVWTDRPGTPAASRALVSDLDLELTDPDGNLYYGNNFAGGQSVPGGSPDERNNVEGLLLSTPRAGRWWVNVSARSLPMGPQDFALVLSGPVVEISSDPSAEAASVAPQPLLEGELAALDFVVRNRGRGPATGFPYIVTIDGRPLESGILPDLQSGESARVQSSWVALRGEHVVALEIDPAASMDELDEGNNRVEAHVTVLHYGVRASLSPSEAEVDPGASCGFVAEVGNTGTVGDTVLVEFTTSALGWSARAEPSSVHLQPGESAQIALSASCPPEALAGERAELTLRVVSSGNSSHRAEASGRALTRQIYGVGLPASPAPARIYPWESAVFDLAVTNSGNGLDVVNIELSGGSPGWMVAQSVQTLSIAARSEAPLELTVAPEPMSLAGNSSTTTVTAKSSGGASASCELSVIVEQFFNLTLGVVPLDQSAPPGGSVRALYLVANNGNGQDRAGIELGLPEGWSAPTEPVLPLAGYEHSRGELEIHIPPGELAGDYQVSLTVRSEGGQVLTEAFPVRVEQVYAVACRAFPMRESLFPGDAASFYVSVTNLGNGRDSFDVAPLGLPEFMEVRRLPGPVPLGPGETAAVIASISPSGDAPPGELGLRFRASSRGSPLAQNTTAVTVSLLAAPAPPQPPPPGRVYSGPLTVGGWDVCLPVLAAASALTAVYAAFQRRAWHRRPPPPFNFK
ncbi:MAG: S8 family serine peptidase [Thermoplasmatota archaeon]